VTISLYWRLSSKLALLSLALLVPTTLIVASSFDPALAHPLALAAVAALIVTTFFANQMADCLNALHQSARSAQLNAVGFLMTALPLLVCWVAGLGVKGAILAYACGFGVRIGVGRSWLRRLTDDAEPTAEGGEGLLLRAGLKLLGVIIGQAVLLRADQLAVGLLLGSHAAGLYAVAATPAGILTVVGASLGQVTFAEAAHGTLRRQLLIRQTAVAVATTGAAALAGVVLVPWVLPALFGHEFAGSVPVAQALLGVQVLAAGYLVVSRAVAGYGMINWAGWSGVLGAVAIIVASVLLVPRFGLFGAAGASATAFGLMIGYLVLALARAKPWHQAVS
jgi:O-antigen/teichoic acid export membrane protein